MIFVFVGPSGAGKKTVIEKVVRDRPMFHLVVSYTTRPRKDGEVDGVDYHFVTREQFLEMAAKHKFVEHKEVHGGHLYGTPTKELLGTRTTILEIDVEGAKEIKRKFPAAHTIFLLPPSYAALEERLRTRKRDTEEEIAGRLARAVHEVGEASWADHWIINDEAERAARDIKALMVRLALNRHRLFPEYRDPELLRAVLSTFPCAA